MNASESEGRPGARGRTGEIPPPRKERTMKRTVAAALTGAMMALGIAAGAGPAAAAPVTVTDDIACYPDGHGECDVDTYEVRCTQAARHLAISTGSHTFGKLVAVATAPSALAGKAKWASGSPDSPGTLVFTAPDPKGSLIRALVAIKAEMGNPSSFPYFITASCYSIVKTGGQTIIDPEPDPDEPGPDLPDEYPVLKKTSITRKQDQ